METKQQKLLRLGRECSDILARFRHLYLSGKTEEYQHWLELAGYFRRQEEMKRLSEELGD